MLLPDNGRAGSFVAERILGTSGSSPLLLILIARTPHTVQQQRPAEDKRVGAKARKTFRARKTRLKLKWCPGLIRVVTAPVLVRHDRLCRPTNRSCFTALLDRPGRAFQEPNRRSENTGLH